MRIIFSIGIILTLLFASLVTAAQPEPAGVKTYLRHEFSESFPLLLKEAEAGNIDSAFYLGLSYNEGSGTNINNVEAARWFKVAADAGHLIAPFEYGTLLDHGYGVERDQGVAKIWFNRGMERIDKVKELAWGGDGIAQVTLSVVFSGRYEQSMKNAEEDIFWSRKAYEQGFPQGFHHYAIDLFRKDEANIEEAYRILLTHSKTGFVWSMYYAYLLCRYDSDKPVPGCEEETKDFMQMAADKGFTPAKIYLVKQKAKKIGDDKEQVTALINKLEAIDLLQDSGGEAAFRMGVFYYNNKAVFDQQKALNMMLKAHKEGYKKAALYLGIMYEYGLGVEADGEKGFEFYLEAAKNKQRWAARKVGVSYEKGRGVEKDTTKSKEWYLKALVSGDKKAQDALISLRWMWPTEKHISYLFFIPGDALVYFSYHVFKEWDVTHEDYGTMFPGFLSIVLYLVGLLILKELN
jgi:uncharacterized protein